MSTKPQKTQTNEEELFEYLGDIRKQIEALNIPKPAYAGILVQRNKAVVTTVCGQKKEVGECPLNTKKIETDIALYLRKLSLENNRKYIAAGIAGECDLEKLGSKLWLSEDIVPFIFDDTQDTKKMADRAANKFDDQNTIKVGLSDENEVDVSFLVTLNDYRKTSSPANFKKLLSLAEKFKGKRISFFNATPQGGGVALMRHALVRLYRLLGVDAHWYVLHDEKPEVFEVTKVKFHNVLQAVADPSTVLNQADKDFYNAWISENAKKFKKIFKQSDVIVIDDPQPSGLIPYIKQVNPGAKIIYRSHIQLVAKLADQPGTSQNITWEFIWENIKESDCFITHPIKEFISKKLPDDKTVMMPASTDPLDGLNKPLSPRQLDYYTKLFNKILIQEGQTPLDLTRPHIVQIARFDPSKGIPDVIESFAKLRKKMEKNSKNLPQLVIVGNGSVDDPDRKPIYNLVTEVLKKPENSHIKEDVKITYLAHNDQLLNTILRQSKIALQLSHKEGFEIKATESLMKGKPVVVYDSGGIPLQVKDDINSFVVKEAGNTNQVAKHLYELLTDHKLYEKMSKAAMKHVRKDVLTVSNAINWLFLSNQLISQGRINSNQTHIKNLVKKIKILPLAQLTHTIKQKLFNSKKS